MRFGPTITPFRASKTNPPATTWKFFRWAVEGAWPGIIWATFWSACAGSLEAISATILGDVINHLRRKPSQTPRNFVPDFRRQVLGPLLRRNTAQQNA